MVQRYQRVEIHDVEPDQVTLSVYRRSFFFIITGASVLLILLTYAVLPIWGDPIQREAVSLPEAQSESQVETEPVTTSSPISLAASTSSSASSLITSTSISSLATSIVSHTSSQSASQSASQPATASQTAQKNLQGPYVNYTQGAHWHGWSSVEKLIVFGDSYSSIGFQIDGARPTEDEPLGISEYPGSTATDGANWVEFLVYNQNQSHVLALDFAVGGATVDQKLIKPPAPDWALRPLNTQIEKEFLPLFNDSFKPESSLFALWTGVNDVSAATNDTINNFEAEFVEFADLVDQLYQHDARNFLFMNTPPIQRTPMAGENGVIERWDRLVHAWNTNLTDLVANFSNTYPEATIFFFDTYKLYNDIIETPCTFPETCGLKSTLEYCDMYAFGNKDPKYKHEHCQYSMDEYFWINNLHPSTQTHNATAHAVADALKIADHQVQKRQSTSRISRRLHFS